jgi:hypothetical protein
MSPFRQTIRDIFTRMNRIAGLVVLFASVAAAQWVNYPTAGIPRTSNGKVNLTAPAPRTADGKLDVSGIWNHLPGENARKSNPEGLPGTVFYFMEPGAKVPYQPWAEALYKEHAQAFGAGRPSEHCLPHGIPDGMSHGGPIKIIQNPGLTVLLYEEFNHYRQIFTDGRPSPPVVAPAWFGYSTGKWEGGDFVVDSTGFNDQSWLDDAGHPHSDAMHTIERFHRPDFGHMGVKVTIDDPKAYTKPWSMNLAFEYAPDTDLIEDMCDNEKDTSHIGK